MFNRNTKIKALLFASAVAMLAMSNASAGGQTVRANRQQPFSGSPRWSQAVPGGTGSVTPSLGASGVSMTPNPPVVSPTI